MNQKPKALNQKLEAGNYKKLNTKHSKPEAQN